MSLLAQNIYHIFPRTLVYTLYTKDLHTKLYSMLWTNLEKFLSFLTMDLHEKLYKCHDLFKGTVMQI